MVTDSREIDLTGLVDMHIHTSPDVTPRGLDDIEAAKQATQQGMRAVVLKSHVTCTADRAAIAEKTVPGTRVLGGITLNHAVGGLNPAAVEAALRLGARVVWMPTVSARNHIQHHEDSSPGITLLTEDEKLKASLFDILELVKQHDVVLATGHISIEEIRALVREAKNLGVEKIVIDHPELPWVDIPVSVQKDLAGFGVFFERCFASTLPQIADIPMARIAAEITQLGIQSTVLATDCGAVVTPSPVHGMRRYLAALIDAGFSVAEIRHMAGTNPARLLGIDESLD
jgi:hypothetical protein